MNIITCIAILIGVMIGIPMVNPSQAGDYAITVTFLAFCLDYLQWCFRQLINTESMMVSVERCFKMIEVEHEKPVKRNYDKIFLKT